MATDLLFTSLQIGALKLKNRIFMPAMHMNMCRKYQVTDQLINFYRERAKGGVGMISVGYATIDELSGQQGNIGAHRDEFIPGLSRLAEAITNEGAAACVQLNHSGRYNHSLFLGGKKPVAPSAVASRMTGETPRELEPEEIEEIIQRFAAAAGRVKQAGFNAVEILAGTGYLISEFLSPLTNQRQDHYGGSLENRMRFGLEVIRAVKQATGTEFPLIVRINGNDFMPGGIGRDELKTFARELVNAGADALCINVGWHEAQIPQIVTKVPRGVFAYLARDIRQQVAVPVIASHRINDPTTARQLISEGFCDMVAMGRALIADPQLPNKAESGQEKTILHCVACAQGCFDNLFKMKAVECLCNPRAGKELETVPQQTDNPKKLMVVGGGPAGMSAAIAAAEQGHQVRLYEQSMRLGGQLHLAGAPPGRAEFIGLAEDLQQQLSALNVTVRLNTAVDREVLAAEQPDAVVLATGGQPLTPPIKGSDLPHVVQAWDVLNRSVQVGENLVIIGGGAVGVETALFLAEQGTLSGEELKFLLAHQAETPEELYRLATTGNKRITLIEMINKLGTNFGKSTRWSMLQDVKRSAVTTLTETRVLEITPTGVLIEHQGQQQEIAADNVILAVGTQAFNLLQKTAAELQIACTVVGDANQPAMVFDAIHQGFAAGRKLL
ncbi:MAG: FAD-dependent oxidoreductase [Desulfuromonadales bacterium]|nr:FAD-dependent oxidoreductase [Desulfuromonadales bacterium]MBN2792576.1 FAD-dependent oxidoreductase [Desulfuromonadales bacterium]